MTHSLKMDSRIERRLHDIAHALEDIQGQGTPEVAAYCNRLNKLVSAVLVNAGPADATAADRRAGLDGRPSAGAAANAPQIGNGDSPHFLAKGVRPLLRLELQRHAVHAVALAGGLRAVVEHVAEMAAAILAMHFHARHAVRRVAWWWPRRWAAASRSSASPNRFRTWCSTRTAADRTRRSGTRRCVSRSSAGWCRRVRCRVRAARGTGPRTAASRHSVSDFSTGKFSFAISDAPWCLTDWTGDIGPIFPDARTKRGRTR